MSREWEISNMKNQPRSARYAKPSLYLYFSATYMFGL